MIKSGSYVIELADLAEHFDRQISIDLGTAYRSAHRKPPVSTPKVQPDNDPDTDQKFVRRFLPTSVKSIVGQARKTFKDAEGGGFADILRFAASTYVQLLTAEAYYPADLSRSKKTNETERPYRDHVVHPLVVYSFGRRILDLWEESGTRVRDRITSRLRQSDIAKDVTTFAESTELDWTKVLTKAWLLASVCHDTAYLVDSGQKLESRLFVALSGSYHEISLQRRILGDCQKLYEKGQPESEVVKRCFLNAADRNLTEGDPEIRTKDGKPERGLNHGEVIALILLHHYGDKDRRATLSKEERASLFLAARAMFDHDRLTKPDALDRLVATKDPFLLFFCLTDLLAEIRLIWCPTTPSSHEEKAEWKTPIWLPLRAIRIDQQARRTEIVFIHTHVAPNLDSGYDYEKACGSGSTKPEALEKYRQYRRLLTALQLVDDSVNLFVDDCYLDPSGEVLATLSELTTAWTSRRHGQNKKKDLALKGVVYAMTRGVDNLEEVPRRYGDTSALRRVAQAWQSPAVFAEVEKQLEGAYKGVAIKPISDSLLRTP